MALTGYFDAAGTKAEPVLTVAGFIARPEQWTAFCGDWQAVLASEGVDELHMTDFAHSKGAFATWRGDERRRSECLRRLAEVPRAHTLRHIVVSLLMDHYNDFNEVFELREAWGSPYVVTTLFALHLAHVWRDETFTGEPLAFVLERGDGDQGQLESTLKRLPLVDRASLSFLPKRARARSGTQYLYPLQACDFLAYEHAKLWRDTLTEERQTGVMTAKASKVRRSLLAITPEGKHYTSRFVDAGLLSEFCRILRVRRRRRA